MTEILKNYRGRFAPSPTGPLHFGSLVAAVGSYLQARCQNGEWFVRIEDLDLPRCIKGADKEILNTLEDYGMLWDGEVLYQSQRDPLYHSALEQLQKLEACYPCVCSRREIADIAKQGSEGPIYPGTCRNNSSSKESRHSIRSRLDEGNVTFHDQLQGEITQNLQDDIGDFIIKRSDGLFAYQLAVVVDDAVQGITEIVRGSDLLISTPRQIWLQQKLSYPTPNYLHLPIAINNDGGKLSKHTFAKSVSKQDPRPILIHALNFLGQEAPKELCEHSLNDLWQWAILNWSAGNIPKKCEIPVADEL